MAASKEDRLPEDQLLGQMNTLILAEHETTSGAFTRTLQILASHTGIQEQLRAELQEAPDTLSYDELNALPYLDALCRKVLNPTGKPVHRNVGQRADEFKSKRWLKDLPNLGFKFSILELICQICARDTEITWLACIAMAPYPAGTGDFIAEVTKVAYIIEVQTSFQGSIRSPSLWNGTFWWPDSMHSEIKFRPYPSGFKFFMLELSRLVKYFQFIPGSTDITWLACIIMAPCPIGTRDLIADDIDPCLPLEVTWGLPI
ncbi:hypothetical protein B0J17DRAFT_633314 [Rhizoctonia solani]|nr:hypothetical protein B0J17DRAFT_633314 [Rhizoctonia solani]